MPKTIKKNRNYYRKLTIRKGRKNKTTIEKLVAKAFYSLTKKEMQMIDNPEQIIKTVTNLIWADSQLSLSPYQAISAYAKQRGRLNKMGTKMDIWKMFRTDGETRSVYNKFNSYMYRNGYSASKYWFDNVTIKIDRSVVFAICELPTKTKGVNYSTLEIEYNYSGGEIYAYMSL